MNYGCPSRKRHPLKLNAARFAVILKLMCRQRQVSWAGVWRTSTRGSFGWCVREIREQPWRYFAPNIFLKYSLSFKPLLALAYRPKIEKYFLDRGRGRQKPNFRVSFSVVKYVKLVKIYRTTHFSWTGNWKPLSRKYFIFINIICHSRSTPVSFLYFSIKK